MGGGRQRWGACVVGAGWGVGHSTLFSKSRLLSRTGGVMKAEWPPRKRAPVGVFSVFFGSNFVRKLPAVAGSKLCVGISTPPFFMARTVTHRANKKGAVSLFLNVRPFPPKTPPAAAAAKGPWGVTRPGASIVVYVQRRVDYSHSSFRSQLDANPSERNSLVGVWVLERCCTILSLSSTFLRQNSGGRKLLTPRE